MFNYRVWRLINWEVFELAPVTIQPSRTAYFQENEARKLKSIENISRRNKIKH